MVLAHKIHTRLWYLCNTQCKNTLILFHALQLSKIWNVLFMLMFLGHSTYHQFLNYEAEKKLFLCWYFKFMRCFSIFCPFYSSPLVKGWTLLCFLPYKGTSISPRISERLKLWWPTHPYFFSVWKNGDDKSAMESLSAFHYFSQYVFITSYLRNWQLLLYIFLNKQEINELPNLSAALA